MSHQADLTIPTTTPSTVRYQNENDDGYPIALYSLIDLSDNELTDLHQLCESQCSQESGENVRLAPQAKFPGQPLRVVFDYHLGLGAQRTYHPLYFIVAVDNRWKSESDGVLLVTLDADSHGAVDSYRTRAVDSGLSYVNLKIMNSSWEDEKGSYEIKPEGGDQDDDDENGSPPDDAGSPTSGPRPQTCPPYGDRKYVGVYMISGLNSTEVINTLEPDRATAGKPGEMRLKESSQYQCRLQAIIPASSPDPIAAAFALHPSRVTKNRFLDEKLMIVVDTNSSKETLVENGIILASLGGITDNGAVLPINSTQRVGYSASSAISKAYGGLTYVDGDIHGRKRVWAASGPTFGVFKAKASRKIGNQALLDLLDTRSEERNKHSPPEICKAMDERVLLPATAAQDWPGWNELLLVNEWNKKVALRNWAQWCWAERFRPTFVRKYFILLDSAGAEVENVMLIKADWDGDVSGGKEEVKRRDLYDGHEVWTVPATEAYSTLRGVVEGHLQWEGRREE